jgi:hypothetical protein
MAAERIREIVSAPPSREYLKERAEAGWKLVAVEWEREVLPHPEEPQRSERKEEVPFGLQVSDDCLHLQENSSEKQVLMLVTEMIVQERPVVQIAEELNRKGFRTRGGANWSPGSVFNLLPRLIEAGPDMFSSEEWVERRQHLFQAI